jgi:hypothetical protein
MPTVRSRNHHPAHAVIIGSVPGQPDSLPPEHIEECAPARPGDPVNGTPNRMICARPPTHACVVDHSEESALGSLTVRNTSHPT